MVGVDSGICMSLGEQNNDVQPCPVCGFDIGVQAGGHDAICANCGYKDPCCE